MNLKLAGRYRGLASIGAVAAALLVCAAPASAEVRSGQGSAAPNPAIPAETDIVAANATYDSVAGTVTFNVTVAGPPTANKSLFTFAALGVGESISVPGAAFLGYYGSSQATAYETEVAEHPAYEAMVPQAVAGDTTTLTVTEHVFAEKPYNFAAVQVVEEGSKGEEKVVDELKFPIAAAPAAESPPPPAAEPPALEIAKRKPVKAKVGKWTKVKVTVANAGGTVTSPILLSVKAPKGVRLDSKSGHYNVSPVDPGMQLTVYFKAKLTKKAKKTSRLTVGAAASGEHVKIPVVLDKFR
jgi:hypothetical protein